MKMKDVTCPICGTVNHNLYLEETEGWMECEHCQNVVMVADCTEKVLIPLYKNMNRLMAVPAAV